MSKSTYFNRRRRGDPPDVAELLARPKRSVPFVLTVAIWRWRWEILLLAGAYAAHTRLVGAGLSDLVAGILMGASIALLLAVPHSRRFLRNRFFCVIDRHRLRVCMNELRTLNYSGNAALILAARATPEGESVWLWMRPGLSVEILERRQEAIAASCWARDSRVSRSPKLAALVRVDILRRDPLARAHIPSPLLGATASLPGTHITTDRALRLVHTVPTGATADERDRAPASSPVGSDLHSGVGSRKTARTSTATPPATAPVVLRNGEDVSDYV
jgi:hypothetical protein